VDLELESDDAAGPFECATCGVMTDTLTAGWRGVTSADPERPDAPALALFCPDCAALELADDA
jgi:hypothetical protein